MPRAPHPLLPLLWQGPYWRERIKASFGYDPLECPHCGCIMQLAEIWEPKRGHIWMKRWTVVITWHSSLKSLFWNKIWTG